MNIKHLREQTGLSQQKFGNFLGIPKRTIEDWEQGLRTPPAYVIELIEYKLRKEGVIADVNPKSVLSEDEKIDAVAKRVLSKYRVAFEELAK
ncbi:MAG: helix-turn-helix domain-containing protein [Clostridia bacterium]|nr:helix-turn-helix domain-containing protein [Clostridia bacterium]